MATVSTGGEENTDQDNDSKETYGGMTPLTINEAEKFMCVIGHMGWYFNQRNIFASNTITVRAHLEYDTHFIGQVGKGHTSYIISDRGRHLCPQGIRMEGARKGSISYGQLSCLRPHSDVDHHHCSH